MRVLGVTSIENPLPVDETTGIEDRDPTPLELSETELAHYAGAYRSEAGTFTLVVDGDRLVGTRRNIMGAPYAADLYLAGFLALVVAAGTGTLLVAQRWLSAHSLLAGTIGSSVSG